MESLQQLHQLVDDVGNAGKRVNNSAAHTLAPLGVDIRVVTRKEWRTKEHAEKLKLLGGDCKGSLGRELYLFKILFFVVMCWGMMIP